MGYYIEGYKKCQTLACMKLDLKLCLGYIDNVLVLWTQSQANAYLVWKWLNSC